MITVEQLQEMFDSIRSNPNVRWRIDDVCLWGYFFTDASESRLQAAGSKLAGLGYRVVGLLDRENDNDTLLFLHVEKEERHTVESLLQRNAELYRLAEEFGLESYDGMDVGPLERAGA